MKSEFSKYFKFPLSWDFFGSFIFDQQNNIVAQYEEDYFKGKTHDDIIKIKVQVIKIINGGINTLTEDVLISVDKNDPTLILRDGLPFLTIRGWGHLTVTRKLNQKKASEIQDSFRDFIVEKLNKNKIKLK